MIVINFIDNLKGLCTPFANIGSAMAPIVDEAHSVSKVTELNDSTNNVSGRKRKQ